MVGWANTKCGHNEAQNVSWLRALNELCVIFVIAVEPWRNSISIKCRFGNSFFLFVQPLSNHNKKPNYLQCIKLNPFNGLNFLFIFWFYIVVPMAVVAISSRSFLDLELKKFSLCKIFFEQLHTIHPQRKLLRNELNFTIISIRINVIIKPLVFWKKNCNSIVRIWWYTGNWNIGKFSTVYQIAYILLHCSFVVNIEIRQCKKKSGYKLLV